MTSKAGGRAPKVDARSAAQQAQQLSVEYDNFIQIDEAENSLDNNVEDPEEQEIQQVIEDKAAKPLITKQIKMVVRKQYKKLMSPTSKVMKDVVITNVQKDGSCDKKIGQLMQRV